MLPHLLYESPDGSMSLAACGALFITIHRRNYTAEEFATLHKHQLAFARTQGAPYPLLTILDVTERHIVSFSKAARESTTTLVRDIAPHVRCSAVVFDRGGFAASAIRSLVTTVNFLSRQPFPTHVFADLEGALLWIESKLGATMDFDRPKSLACVEELRARPHHGLQAPG